MKLKIEMPAACGDWGDDCTAGRAAAGEVIGLLRAGVAPLALQSAAQQLAARPGFDGVSVGFYAGLAAQLS